MNITSSTHASMMRSSRRTAPAKWLAIVTSIAVVLLSGCATHMPAPFREPLPAMKAESLKGWETAMLDGKPLLESLGQRTAIVYGYYESVSVKSDGPESTIESASGRVLGTSTGVPIAEGGYFLIAGHAAHRALSLHLVVFLPQENGRLHAQKVPARIVWQPNIVWESPEIPIGPDFAVVYAETGPLAPFTISMEPPRIDDPIVIAGWQLAPFTVPDPEGSRLAAGRLLSVAWQDAVGSSPAFVVLRHDAPSVAGDSGGPVLDRKGNLIGVHSGDVRISLSFWRWLTIGLGREPTQLDVNRHNSTLPGTPREQSCPTHTGCGEVIQNDRRRMTGNPSASKPQSSSELADSPQ